MPDAFQPTTHRSTRDPFTFITSHGTEDDRPKEVKVKFDRRLLGAIMKDIIAPDDKWPQYRSIHDFIADACWHRLTFLNDWDPDVIPEDVKADLDMYGRMAANQYMAERIAKYEEAAGKAQELIEKVLVTDDHASVTEAVALARVLLSSLPQPMQWEMQDYSSSGMMIVESLASEDDLPPSATNDILTQAQQTAFIPKEEGNGPILGRNKRARRKRRPKAMVLDSLFIPKAY